MRQKFPVGKKYYILINRYILAPIIKFSSAVIISVSDKPQKLNTCFANVQ